MTGSVWQRLTRGAARLLCQPDWPHFAGPDWAEPIMTTSVTDRFHAKQGRSTGRWVLHADGQRLTVYLKRHYRLPWLHGLLATLWPGGDWSPAMQEWRHLEWARAQGLPVPRPVAAGEFIGPWGRLQSFLAVEELTGMLPLHEAIPAAAAALDAATFSRWKRALTAEVARLTRHLHQRRTFHKDLYLCHFYILPNWSGPLGVPGQTFPLSPVLGGEGWGEGVHHSSPPSTGERGFARSRQTRERGRVHLIDLHRLAFHRWTWPVCLVKDLAQLLYSSDVAGVNDRDRLCFWRMYLGAARRTVAGRVLRWLVVGKWRRYRRHNERTRKNAAVNARPPATRKAG